MRQRRSAKFTEHFIRNLKSSDTRLEWFDSAFSGGAFGIRVYPSGRKTWAVTYRHEGRRRRSTIGTYPDWSLRKARKEARSIVKKADDGRDPQAEKQKLKSLPPVEKYYRDTFKPDYLDAGALRQSTRDAYKWVFEKHVLNSEIANIRIDRLDQKKVRPYIRQLKSQGYSFDSIDNIVRYLRALLNFAVEEGEITTNPMKSKSGSTRNKGLRRFYKNAPRRKDSIEAWDKDEQLKFLEATKKKFPELYPFFLTGLQTGLRPGELIALQWTDVDFLKRRIFVRRNFSHGALNEPKTETGKRAVDLTDGLVSVLKRHQTHLKEQWLKKGGESPEWCFPSESGGLMDLHNLRQRVYRKIVEKAGIRYLPLGCLRHCFATLLLQSGTPISIVSEWLGHKDSQTTFKHYKKFIEGAGRENLDVLPMASEIQ